MARSPTEASVQRLLAELATRPVHSAARERTVALLLIDLADFEQHARRGDEHVQKVLRRYAELVDRCIQDQSGTPMGALQDAHLASFPSTRQAAQVAMEIQRKARDANKAVPEAERLYPRMGLHSGPAMVSPAGMASGRILAQVGRIHGQAIEQEIAASSTAFGLMTSEMPTRVLGRIAMDEGLEEVNVYELVWREDGRSYRVQRGWGRMVSALAMGLLAAGCVTYGLLVLDRNGCVEFPHHPGGSDPGGPPVPFARPLVPDAGVGAERQTAQAPPRVPTGTLTLLTVPECTVTAGKRTLGKTPLFNASLPAGTHLLELKGPDGKRYRLSAPIQAGKNTAFRVNLADLPSR